MTVQDHWAEGGLGEAVLAAFADGAQPNVALLAVRELPGSGKPAELMAAAGIDADHIANAARDLVDPREPSAVQGSAAKSSAHSSLSSPDSPERSNSMASEIPNPAQARRESS